MESISLGGKVVLKFIRGSIMGPKEPKRTVSLKADSGSYNLICPVSFLPLKILLSGSFVSSWFIQVFLIHKGKTFFASTPSCFFFPIPVLLSQSKTLWNNLHSLMDLPYPSFAPEPAKFLPSVYVWNSCGKDYQRSTYQTQSSKTSALNPGSWYWRKSHNHKELCQDIVMVSSQLDIYYWSITL